MKEQYGRDNLAVAWQYPGQELEVIPARYSRMTSPTSGHSISPSSSLAPSSSSSPSFGPSSSMAPSSSLFPTRSKFCIEISIVYDGYPQEISWDLIKINGISSVEFELLRSHYASFGDTSQTETFCLVEGDYEFIISDIVGDGMMCCDYGEVVCMDCKYGDAYYNITTASGALISEGGDFDWSESTNFSLPFIPGISISPSSSLAPSSSSSPSFSPSSSMAPSSSLFPTRSKFCIEISIVYDNNPHEISWDLIKINGISSVEYELLRSHNASLGDTLQTETFCLVEGDYEFIISDTVGDGMMCCDYGEGVCMDCKYGDAYYNITTASGALISEGGDFDWSESTNFSLPFIPPL
jgi:hypothetical protein